MSWALSGEFFQGSGFVERAGDEDAARGGGLDLDLGSDHGGAVLHDSEPHADRAGFQREAFAVVLDLDGSLAMDLAEAE